MAGFWRFFRGDVFFAPVQMPEPFSFPADQPERYRQYDKENGLGGAIPEVLKTPGIYIEEQKGNAKAT